MFHLMACTVHGEMLSRDGLEKAVMMLRDDGLFDVELFRLTKNVIQENDLDTDCFWEPIPRPYMTDTLLNTEKPARERSGEARHREG